MISGVFGAVVIDVFDGSGVFTAPGTEAAKDADENDMVGVSVKNGDDAAFNVVSDVAFGIEKLGVVLNGTGVFDRATKRDDNDGVRVAENSNRENFLDTGPE